MCCEQVISFIFKGCGNQKETIENKIVTNMAGTISCATFD
jgi:hypothetical protein